MSEQYTGLQDVTAALNEFNAQSFLIWQLIRRINTATIVQVKAVTSSGSVAVPGTVDIIPLIQQVDGTGKVIDQGIIHKCPYIRIQGGANAIIMDPQVGDIGIALFASRDISNVVKNKGSGPPGSHREFDMADAIYIGGMLNGIPNQYIQFNSAGVTINDSNGNKIEMKSGGVTITGDVNVTGTITASGEIYSDSGTHSVGLHTHTQANDGAGDAEAPTNPPIG